MKLSISDIETYAEKGWLKIENFFQPNAFDIFYQEFNYLLHKKIPCDLKIRDGILDEVALKWVFENDRDGLGAIYRSLRHLPSLHKLLLSDDVEELYRSLHPEVKFINLCPYTGTRLDFKGEEKYLFDWHQDYHYIQLSMNSLVYWFPLTPLDSSGGIEILEGSHNQGLLNAKIVDPLNKNKNGAQTISIAHNVNSDLYKRVKPTANVGDLIVFSTLTVHRSQPQKERDFRVTTQFRLGDFGHHDAIFRNWPVGLLEGRLFSMDHPEFVDLP
jgi:hypothetical protein